MKEISALQVKIEEIGEALKHGYYHCALALALTLPDICGGDAYPEKNSRERYIKWYDDNVSKLIDNSNDNYLNGYACYQLRCIYLHNGEFNIKGKNHNINIKSFRLHYDCHSIEYGGFNYIEYPNPDQNHDNTKYDRIDIDVTWLCKIICSAAKLYLSEHSESEKLGTIIEDKLWDNTTYKDIGINPNLENDN